MNPMQYETLQPVTKKPVRADFSSESNEFYTPVEIAHAARQTLGHIDLDPASCEIANTNIQAEHIFTIFDGGLSKPWFGRVLCNPPGGKISNNSQQAIWWDKLLTEYQSGRVSAAIFVAFNAEIIRLRQEVFDFPVCFPLQRQKFLKEVGGELVVDPHPTKFNCIVHLPSSQDNTASLFYQYFSDLGRVVFDHAW